MKPYEISIQTDLFAGEQQLVVKDIPRYLPDGVSPSTQLFTDLCSPEMIAISEAIVPEFDRFERVTFWNALPSVLKRKLGASAPPYWAKFEFTHPFYTLNFGQQLWAMHCVINLLK